MFPLQTPELPDLNSLSLVLVAAGSGVLLDTERVCSVYLLCNCSAEWKWEFAVGNLMKWGLGGFGLVFLCCKGRVEPNFCIFRACKSLGDFVERYWLQFGLICAFKFGEIILGKLEDSICRAGLEGIDNWEQNRSAAEGSAFGLPSLEWACVRNGTFPEQSVV